MTIKLYNTLHRELEEFRSINNDEVSLYTCGPTVYDYAHIGNLRAFVFGDTLRRTLELSGYNVKHVMNITDVGHLESDADTGEDKLEKGAKKSGKTVWDIADFYTQAFLEDVNKLNILPPNGYRGGNLAYAKATDFIDEQINIVKVLLDNKHAYITKQAIYFDVTTIPDYGNLSGQQLDEKGVGVRDEVITDDDKKHPQDFAVWFFTVGRFINHSMSWSSPWGNGFPGWHLECSTIIHATLGDPIDIHTGGVDHIGTHHTNEIAQTKAAFGNSLANYWLHNEHLLVDGMKMSKSKGNYYTLQDITDKGYSPLVLRLVFLQAHYRSQQNFSWDSMVSAKARLKSYQSFADLRFQPNNNAKNQPTDFFTQSKSTIKEYLFNDLGTPAALAFLDSIIDKVKVSGGILSNDVALFEDFLGFIDDSLGLALLSSTDIDDKQRDKINYRSRLRSDRDWAGSDKIRQELLEQGIELNDEPDDRTTWLRTS